MFSKKIYAQYFNNIFGELKLYVRMSFNSTMAETYDYELLYIERTKETLFW